MQPKQLFVYMLLLIGFAAKAQSKEEYAITISSRDDNKQKSFFKKNSIRIYPNPSYSDNITVYSSCSNEIHFYIFDLEGTLVFQSRLRSKEKILVNNLKKGSYMYDVFLNDTGIEQGKIIVK